MKGQELKRLRRRLGMTQEQLADALELHWNSIARMERDVFPIMKTTELSVRFLLLTMSKTKRGK